MQNGHEPKVELWPGGVLTSYCPRCGETVRWNVRPESLPAGVHEGLAKAAEVRSEGVRAEQKPPFDRKAWQRDYMREYMKAYRKRQNEIRTRGVGPTSEGGPL